MKLENQFELAKWKKQAHLLDRKELEEMMLFLLEQHFLLEEKIKQLPFMFSDDYGTATDNGSDSLEPSGGWDAWGIVLPHG